MIVWRNTHQALNSVDDMLQNALSIPIRHVSSIELTTEIAADKVQGGKNPKEDRHNFFMFLRTNCTVCLFFVFIAALVNLPVGVSQLHTLPVCLKNFA